MKSILVGIVMLSVVLVGVVAQMVREYGWRITLGNILFALVCAGWVGVALYMIAKGLI